MIFWEKFIRIYSPQYVGIFAVLHQLYQQIDTKTMEEDQRCCNWAHGEIKAICFAHTRYQTSPLNAQGSLFEEDSEVEE